MNQSQRGHKVRAPASDGPPRRVFAMVLMVVSSVAISFGGLIIRNMEDADSWQINFYRSIALTIAVTIILLFQYRRLAITYVKGIGQSGVVGGVMLAAAGITFLQSLAHTTVANTLFMLSAIPFITAGLARVFLKERLPPATLIAMATAAIGISIMLSEGFGVGSIYGNAMALTTACCFASFAVIVRRNRQTDMLPTLLVSGLVIMIVTLFMRIGDLGISLHDLLLCFLWGGLLSGIANWRKVGNYLCERYRPIRCRRWRYACGGRHYLPPVACAHNCREYAFHVECDSLHHGGARSCLLKGKATPSNSDCDGDGGHRY